MVWPCVYKTGVRAQQEGLCDPDIVTAVCTEMEEQTPVKARDLPTGKAPTQDALRLWAGWWGIWP